LAIKRRRLAARRRTLGFTQESLAMKIGVDPSTVGRWESGEFPPQPCHRRKLAAVLDLSPDELDGLLAASASEGAADEVVSVVDQAEALRLTLHESIAEHGPTDASLDDWELLVSEYGRATRHRPAVLMLADLTTDLAELQQMLTRCRSVSGLRRLTRVTAQMAGLVCLTVIKMDERGAFRRWARTARLAAAESGDPLTHSWVRAQEAYGYYYAGDLPTAIDVAGDAQALAGRSPCVGAALAAALEARAHAALGGADRRHEAETALRRAEVILWQLAQDALIASAFGYDEPQLRFHGGNTYTHLHDTEAAWREQQRALTLYPHSNFMDRALTRLDRAECLTHDGDINQALPYAAETLECLTGSQRQGIITSRAREIFSGLDSNQRALPTAREFRELLVAKVKEIEQ
jgi:transcriptional regulator with XRE-family HTH domain